MRRVIPALKEMRARERMTLADVSEKTGIAVSTLSKLETRKTKGVDFETVEKLCELFQVEPGALFRLVPQEEYDRLFLELASAPAA